ncbi:MAG: ABC transporter permease [Firmicutes bacterium]|nr:ABC transporter permease [Bacillota bacterium]
MYKYIIKRILALIPVLIGVTFIVFMIMSYSPGDPARMLLGAGATAENIEALREEMGLNDPAIVQYGRYLLDLLHGDLGISYVSGDTVAHEIFSRFPNTVALAVGAILFATIVSIPIGIISATKQYSIFDNTGMVIALLGVSMPSFWLGLMLILLFSVYLGWLPSGGVSGFSSLILPSITLGAESMATITRTTRSSMLEVIRQDYIRTARSKGVPERKVITKHALKNALIPTITVTGIEMGALLGGAILTETVFSWPGVGRLLIDAIQNKNTPVVLGCLVVFSICFGIVNLIVDILYAYIDPRIKSQYK